MAEWPFGGQGAWFIEPHTPSPIAMPLNIIFYINVMLAMMGHMVVLGTALGTLTVPGYWSLQMG